MRVPRMASGADTKKHGCGHDKGKALKQLKKLLNSLTAVLKDYKEKGKNVTNSYKKLQAVYKTLS